MTLPSFLSKQISKAQKPNNEGKSSWQNSWKFSTGKIIKWWYQSGLVRNVHGICSHQDQMSCDFIILNMLYAFCAIFLKFFLYLSFWLCWVLIAVHGLFSSCREWGPVPSCSVQASYHGGISCGTWAPGHVGFSSFSMWAQKLWLPGSRAQAQQLWYTGLVALQHVGSS